MEIHPYNTLFLHLVTPLHTSIYPVNSLIHIFLLVTLVPLLTSLLPSLLLSCPLLSCPLLSSPVLSCPLCSSPLFSCPLLPSLLLSSPLISPFRQLCCHALAI